MAALGGQKYLEETEVRLKCWVMQSFSGPVISHLLLEKDKGHIKLKDYWLDVEDHVVCTLSEKRQ